MVARRNRDLSADVRSRIDFLRTQEKVMRSTMLAVGVPILTGTEKVIEAWLVAMSPEWLTAITTRF